MKTGSNCKLHGVIPAIVTPLRPNGDVDEALLRKQTEYLVSSGVNGLFVCGGTGEGAYLTTAEKKRVFEVIQETAAGRVFLCLAVINSNTRATLAELEALSICKPDFFVSTPPYYHAMTQQDILSHYAAVTAASTAPVILYNIQGRTGVNIAPETIAYLFNNVENIVAVKEASGNISQVAKIMQLTDGKIDLYSGNDDQVVPILSLGGSGVISVLSNVAPRKTHDMVQKFLDGDVAGSREIQLRALPLIDALFCEVNPIPVKAALNLMGKEVGPLRLPLTEMEPQNQERLAKAMKDFGIKLA